MTKRDLFRKPPSPWDVLIDYLPLIALIMIFIMAVMVLIYCQATISLGHMYGIN